MLLAGDEGWESNNLCVTLILAIPTPSQVCGIENHWAYLSSVPVTVGHHERQMIHVVTNKGVYLIWQNTKGGPEKGNRSNQVRQGLTKTNHKENSNTTTKICGDHARGIALVTTTRHQLCTTREQSKTDREKTGNQPSVQSRDRLRAGTCN